MQQRAVPSTGPLGPEFLLQSQDGTMTLLTTSSTGTTGHPVMVTLNPYSTQLVDSLNRMMRTGHQQQPQQQQFYPELEQSEYSNSSANSATLNPQLVRLTATLRKKRCELGHPGPCRPATCGRQQQVNIHENTLQLAAAQSGGDAGRSSLLLDNSGRLPPAVNPAEVVFRAVSPHGHVYWEINPTKSEKKLQQQPGGTPNNNKSQHSTSSDENTNSDLQNLSDFSDDDHGAMCATRAHSEMSRQSSSRFSESRPLIYSSSSSNTSPGNSAASANEFMLRHHHGGGGGLVNEGAAVGHNKLPPRFSRGMGRPWNGGGPLVGTTMSPNYHEEVYAYAATDFSAGAAVNSAGGGSGAIPEQVQSQVQIRDCRAVPVSVKSKEYIMAKIADYTERHMNHQV
jgi:hypothetical protein